MIKNASGLRYILFSLMVAGLLALNLWPVWVQAGPSLPPRDPPGPQEDRDDDDDDGRAEPVGAYIELQTQIAPAGAWSVVQWQDSAGGWHDVEGWRGPLADNRRWWVAAKDFKTGPFRWAVTQGQAGSPLGVSAPFNLPSGANEVVQVVLLKP